LYSPPSLELRLLNLHHLDERTGALVDSLVRLVMDRLDRARAGWEDGVRTDDLEAAGAFEDVEDFVLEPADGNLVACNAQLNDQCSQPLRCDLVDGREAISAVEEETFDAVLLDLAMPDLEGLETLRRLHEIQPELQVMILSGRATVKTAVEAMRLGATDIFEKPTDVETLVERIKSARATRIAHEDDMAEEHIEEILRKRGW
jgi:CheY-like chemotaxis protein